MPLKASLKVALYRTQEAIYKMQNNKKKMTSSFVIYFTPEKYKKKHLKKYLTATNFSLAKAYYFVCLFVALT